MISRVTVRKAVLGLSLGILVAALAVGGAALVAPAARNKMAAAARATRDLTAAMLDGRRVRAESRGEFTNVIFLHHSVGRNLIRQGGLRELLSAAGFSFYDHDYNGTGLVKPDGAPAGYSYRVPGDDTDPGGLARIFEQPAHGLPLNAWSALLRHEAIVVKSCFLSLRNLGDAELEHQKRDYLRMREAIDRHRDRLFIVLTSPPANPAETTAAAAARARTLSQWLLSEEFRGGRSNLYVFDLFGLLAENDPAMPDYGMLRASYREAEDSHPNQAANRTVAPILARFIEECARDYRARGRREAMPAGGAGVEKAGGMAEAGAAPAPRAVLFCTRGSWQIYW